MQLLAHKKFCFVLFFPLILYGLSTKQNTQDSGKKMINKELLFKGFFAVASTGKLVLAAMAFVITRLQEENPVAPPLEWPNGDGLFSEHPTTIHCMSSWKKDRLNVFVGLLSVLLYPVANLLPASNIFCVQSIHTIIFILSFSVYVSCWGLGRSHSCLC